MTKTAYRYGFTLVEILLAVTIIGILAALLIPAYNLAIRSRQNAQAASKLRTAVTAFELYASENGSYPADVDRGVVPPEMVSIFSSMHINWFPEVNSLGGRWDWGKNRLGALATIAIASPTVAQSQMIEFDKLIDDGNLNTGRFRQDDDHYFYIIKQ
jgi:prepilin-type N-terminal cleavage/methylation domain-containing protein